MFRNLLALSITGREKILQKDKPTLIYSFDGSSSPIELKTQKNPYTTKGGGMGRRDNRDKERERRVGRNFSQFC